MSDWKSYLPGLFLVIVVAAWILLFASSPPYPPSEPEISDQTETSSELETAKGIAEAQRTGVLIEIGLSAWLAYSNVLSAKLFFCLIQEGSRQSSDAPASQQPEYMTDFLSLLDKQCAVYTQMESVITPFVDQIIADKKIENYYVFSMLEPADEIFMWAEKDIGIFPSLADCQRFERALHELDVSTRRCRLVTVTPLPPPAPVR